MSRAAALTTSPTAVVGGRTRVGRVVANTGRDVLVMIENDEEARAALRLGEMVLLSGGGDPSVGVVSGMNMPAPGLESDGADLWLAQVELVGTLGRGEAGFSRAVRVPPALGDLVHKASSADLRRLFRNGDDTAYPIGTIMGQSDVAATIDGKALLNGGFAVLGAGQSGKSATIACLVRALLRHRHPVKTVLIDPYNEYGRSFGKAAVTITPEPGLFPHWILSFEEIAWVLSCNGGPLTDDERSILEEAIPLARSRFAHRSGTAREQAGLEAVSVDGPIPYRMGDIISHIDRNMAGDAARDSVAYRRLRTRILTAIADPKFAVLFGTVAATDNLPALMKHLFRLERAAAPMAVVQLGSLSSGVDQLIVSVICRLAAALAEWGGGMTETLLVFEDAARFAPEVPKDRAAELTLSAIRHLGGRPRKLGTSIGLVASNPRAVSRDVLRHCGTFFVHRMTSQSEIEAVEDMLPEAADAHLNAVANLGEGEAVGIGRGVPLAGRIALAPLPQSAIPSEHAPGAPPPMADEDEVAAIVQRWRYCGAGEGLSSAPLPPPMPSR